MGQNTALKIVKLENLLFSKTAIENTIPKREHIFELQKNGKDIGFISLYDLKDYLSMDIATDDILLVRNIDQSNFQNLYEHPIFQRRKPQIIDTTLDQSILEEKQYYIIKSGQKTGPYNKVQIEDFISNKEIIMNDMISINAGQTWHKIYATAGFDRRELRPADELPRLPDEDFLKVGPADLRNSDEITEATSSLAYLGNLKKGKLANIDYEQLDLKDTNKKSLMVSSYKWLFIISIMGIGYFLYNIKTALQSPLSEAPTQSLGEHVETLNPTDSSHNPNMNSAPRRMDKFQTRPMNPVRPRNIGQQKSFREANPNLMPQQQINPDPNYYYDNAAPMELDPVREQVSRETFDNSPGDPGPPPADDALFNQESSN